MTLASGQSLRERLRDGPLPIAEAVRLVSEVADALDYAHRHGVVHRDIKPENVLLHEGLPLIADFGIGKAMAVTATTMGSLTQVGMVVGTPAYMSPEQSAGDAHIHGLSDIYEAYQLCVRGRLALMQYTGEQMRAGIDYLERAIRKDPHYALEHALLAFAYRDVAGASGAIDMHPDEAIARAKRAIAQAMADDPELGMVHTISACITCICDFDWQGGERAFQRAIGLDPGNSDAWDLYGQMLGAMARYDDALVALRKAQELDPLAHRSDVANILTRAGRAPPTGFARGRLPPHGVHTAYTSSPS